MLELPAALLDAILAAPADDGPRLAAADWLEEAGDAAHAELVRVQCRLAAPGRKTRGESAALRVREAELVAAVTATLSERCGIDFRRGFPDYLTWSDDPETLVDLLPALATLRTLHVNRSITADLFPLLAPLRSLERLVLRLDRDRPLTRAEAAPLSRLTRCAGLSVVSRGGRSLLSERHLAAIRAAQRRRAAAAPAGEREAKARQLLGDALVTDAEGGEWLAEVSAVRRVAAAADVPALRGLTVAFVSAVNWPALPAGLRGLDTRHVTDLEARHLRGLPELREAALYTGTRDPDAWAGWSDGSPRLAALSLTYTGAHFFARDPFAAVLDRCRTLRVLHLTGEPLRPATLERLELPELVELYLDAPDVPAAGLLERFPSLRVLRLGRSRDGWSALVEPCARRGVLLRIPTATTAALPAWFDAHAVERPCEGGVALRLPAWFAPEQVPPPDPRFPEVTPLGRWREWGDAGDDGLTLGPARVELDAVAGRVKATERAAVLRAGRTFFPVSHWAAVVAEAGRFACAGRSFGHLHQTRRYLWCGPDRAVRLRLDYPDARAAGFDAWLGRVADTLTF